LTPEKMKLLTTVVIGMMVMCRILNWKLCYIASHRLLLLSIVSGLRKHILLVVLLN
jgi:hypothetical protein